MAKPAEPADVPAELIFRQMNRICASPLLAKSSALQELLRFLIRETLDGRAGQLKRRYVFEKHLRKWLGDEASVSTYKGRLREELDRYYQSASSEDWIELSLDSESYVPNIRRRPVGRPIVGRDAEIKVF